MALGEGNLQSTTQNAVSQKETSGVTHERGYLSKLFDPHEGYKTQGGTKPAFGNPDNSHGIDVSKWFGGGK